VAACVGVGLLAGTAGAQAPREVGRPGMAGRLVAADVTSLWVQLSFEVKVSDEKLLKLRPMFQSELESRKSIADKFKGGEGFEDLREEMAAARKAFIENVREQLTDEEQEALDKWFSEVAARRPAGGERRPGERVPRAGLADTPMAR